MFSFPTLFWLTLCVFIFYYYDKTLPVFKLRISMFHKTMRLNLLLHAIVNIWDSPGIESVDKNSFKCSYVHSYTLEGENMSMKKWKFKLKKKKTFQLGLYFMAKKNITIAFLILTMILLFRFWFMKIDKIEFWYKAQLKQERMLLTQHTKIF